MAEIQLQVICADVTSPNSWLYQEFAFPQVDMHMTIEPGTSGIKKTLLSEGLKEASRYCELAQSSVNSVFCVYSNVYCILTYATHP